MNLNKATKTIKGYTLIETLISLALIASFFFLLVDSLTIMYRANQYISTLGNINLEATEFKYIINRLLISTDPQSITCNLPGLDVNGDGNTDNILIRFKTLKDTEYELVLLNHSQIPYRANAYYNHLVLYKYNQQANQFQPYVGLTGPEINIDNYTVECTPVQQDTLQNVSYSNVSMHFIISSTTTYLLIPNLVNKKIVTNYPISIDKLVVN